MTTVGTVFGSRLALKILFLIFAFICAANPVTGWADESPPGRQLSLLDVYQLARESAPRLTIAGYRLDNARAQKDIARGRFMPSLSLFGDWSENRVRYEGNELGRLPTQEYPGERYGVQVRSTLLNMRAFRDWERQDALAERSEALLASAEIQLLTEVVTAYLRVLLSEEKLVQTTAELEAIERQLAEATALYERSLLPVTQMLETQTRADTLRAEVIDARGQILIAREGLIQLVGRRDIDLLAVSEKVSLSSTVSTAEAAAALAQQHDPAIEAAEQALKAAQKSVSKEKGSWIPEVDFVYNSQYSDVGFDNLTSPARTTDSYSISIRYLLFEGGAGVARTRAAWADFYAAKSELDLANRESGANARAAWVRLEVANERLIATQQASRTSQVNLEATEAAAKVGTVRLTDVLVALAQNTRAARDLTQARFEAILSWLALELATGADPEVVAASLSANVKQDNHMSSQR
ncbi:TolC family protein [Luminiphilus sp.]|nr:TolC family protein [Luminiphilus sp.]